MKVVKKDGSRRMVLWHNSVLKDRDGEIIGLLSSGEDITDKRMAQKKIEESREKI